MVEWFKRLLCRHDWRHVVHVTVYTTNGGSRVEKLYECTKCGKLDQREK